MHTFETSLQLDQYRGTEFYFYFNVYEKHSDMIDAVEGLCGCREEDMGACCVSPQLEMYVTTEAEKKYRILTNLFFNAESFEKMYLGHEVYHAAHNVHTLIKQLALESSIKEVVDSHEETAADIAGYLCEVVYGQVLRKIQKIRRENKK